MIQNGSHYVIGCANTSAANRNVFLRGCCFRFNSFFQRNGRREVSKYIDIGSYIHAWRVKRGSLSYLAALQDAHEASALLRAAICRAFRMSGVVGVTESMLGLGADCESMPWIPVIDRK